MKSFTPVFTDAPRNVATATHKHIPLFDELNAALTPEAKSVRTKTESMFSRYHDAAKAVLRTRLRSTDDNTHLSAYFELAIHELLLQAGCNILEIEPMMCKTSRSPDFLAQTHSGERFYLEAMLSTGPCESLKRAVLKKAGRYGKLQLSYVIAVNAFSHEVDRNVIVDIFANDASIDARVSAILFLQKLTPWNFGQKHAHMIPNPRAQYPAPLIF